MSTVLKMTLRGSNVSNINYTRSNLQNIRHREVNSNNWTLLLGVLDDSYLALNQ